MRAPQNDVDPPPTIAPCLHRPAEWVAQAQYTDGVVKIGVLSESVYADFGGPGSVVAAKLAVEDFDPAAHGMKVGIVSGDTRTSPMSAPTSRAKTWYWDMTEPNRAFTKRWQVERPGKFPSMSQAGVYSAVTHYLKTVDALKSDADGKAVVAKMKELPTDEPLFGKSYVRSDGRKIHPAYVFEVKKPEESKYPGDDYKLRATIPAAEAFRPLKEGGCPMING